SYCLNCLTPSPTIKFNAACIGNGLNKNYKGFSMKRIVSIISTFVLALVLSSPSYAFLNLFKSEYTKTKYPIVLAHGMGGFKSLGPVDYWYQIPNDLSKSGARVFVTQVAPFQASEVRGEQLLAQVEEILAITGAEKVNLIGHSHGNQSIRYVAAVIPEKVASATSVGGPTKGSAAADLIVEAAELPVIGGPAETLISSVVNGFGWLTGVAAGGNLQ